MKELILRCNRKTENESSGNIITELQFVSTGADGKPLQEGVASASATITLIGKESNQEFAINQLRRFKVGEVITPAPSEPKP